MVRVISMGTFNDHLTRDISGDGIVYESEVYVEEKKKKIEEKKKEIKPFLAGKKINV